MSCLSQSHTQLTPAKKDSAALSCCLLGVGTWSCPSPSAWAWFVTSLRHFQIVKVAKKYSLYSLVLSVHLVSWISSPQSQMSARPGKDEAAGMQTWRGDHTSLSSSCKLLDWVSIFFRFTPLGPSVLLLPTWLKPRVRTKLEAKRWAVEEKPKQNVHIHFCARWRGGTGT